MLWAEELKVSIRYFSKHHIDAIIERENDGKDWRFTGFNGHPETSRRKEGWKLITDLNRSYKFPWLCVGYYNEILTEDEKRGGNSRPGGQMKLFQEVVDECNFQEVPFIGPKMTWCRGSGDDIIFERLDRGLANYEWMEMFGWLLEDHHMVSTSDHLPLVFTISKYPTVENRKKRDFKFDNIDRKSVV